jgi:LmbE family N-acetylglucosaminyl deacetylase
MLLMDWLREIQPDVVLSPLAVGRHVDHAIVSDGFRNIAVEQHLRVFLYEDMPYSTGRFPPGSPDSVNAALTRTRWSVTDTESIEIDIDRKANAILSYKSQNRGTIP